MLGSWSRLIIPLAQQFRFGERAFSKIIPQRQLTNLGVQWRKGHRLACRSAAGEGIDRALQQLPLPFGDLVGLPLEMLGQLDQGLAFTQGCQRYLGLEGWRMRAAGAPRGALGHRKLLLAEPPSAQHDAWSFHLRRCSDLRSNVWGLGLDSSLVLAGLRPDGYVV